MNATPRPWRDWLDRLGTRPDLGLSDGRHWRLIFLGAVIFVLNALPEAGWVSSPADRYAWLLALCLGPVLVSQGASGLLLRRGNETLCSPFRWSPWGSSCSTSGWDPRGRSAWRSRPARSSRSVRGDRADDEAALAWHPRDSQGSPGGC